MLILKCNILIIGKDNKKIMFDYVSSVEITTSIKDLTDTAKITVPRKMRWREKPLTDFIERGNKITIQLGYENYKIETVFTGYVKSFTNRTPITIECENEMYLLKQTKVQPRRYEKFDFKQFMSEYASDITVELPSKNDLNFGEVIIKDEVSVAGVLEQLKKNNPFNAFFRESKMYAVLTQTTLNKEGEIKTIVFNAEKNIIDSKNIKYTLADDVNIRVKAISILANNKRLEAISPKGKNDGELRTFHCSKYKTQAELQKYADDMLNEVKIDKAEGSFTAFGIPYVRKADRVKIIDKINADINNKTFNIEAVKYSFGTSGYRQTITLGNELK
ncbi:MAG: hypothetical protein LBT56_00035 [Prevotellaceae bacterium]|jgi:hypothetical protein|nr:hypothetical protein [Prevotellaceae bacterium]